MAFRGGFAEWLPALHFLNLTQCRHDNPPKMTRTVNDEIRYTAQTPPVLLLTFSRPSQAARVLERIKEARPPSLYVACDGPRPGRDDDLANIRAIHEMVGRIDWCGNVKTLFRDRNLGCGPAVSQAITWCMEQAGEGIILEDDCLPDPTFFRFCGEMLDRYRETTNVWQVSGYNYLSGRYESESDYMFSQCGFSWGWATWKRAWNFYDYQMKSWPAFKKLGYHRIFPFSAATDHILEDAYNDKPNTWDYQWNYARAANSGLSLVPKFSLIENIGFGVDATHGSTLAGSKPFIAPVRPMPFPMKHPQFLFADNYYDRMLDGILCNPGGTTARLKRAASVLIRRYRWSIWVRECFRRPRA